VEYRRNFEESCVERNRPNFKSLTSKIARLLNLNVQLYQKMIFLNSKMVQYFRKHKVCLYVVVSQWHNSIVQYKAILLDC